MRACEHVTDRKDFMESPQCLEDVPGALVTQDLCLPSRDLMARHIRSLVKRTGIISLFIASDKDPDVPDLQRRVGTKVGSVLQVYSGTPLLWIPWGPGGVSCIQWNPSIVGDLVKCPVYSGTPLYCGHLGDPGGVSCIQWNPSIVGDLVKCPVYSGAPLLWTPWGPSEVSCIQWNPSIVGTLGFWCSVLYTVNPLYCGHLGDLVKCPV